MSNYLKYERLTDEGWKIKKKSSQWIQVLTDISPQYGAPELNEVQAIWDLLIYLLQIYDIQFILDYIENYTDLDVSKIFVMVIMIFLLGSNIYIVK